MGDLVVRDSSFARVSAFGFQPSPHADERSARADPVDPLRGQAPHRDRQASGHGRASRPGHETGTLVNALLYHCGSLPLPPPRLALEDDGDDDAESPDPADPAKELGLSRPVATTSVALDRWRAATWHRPSARRRNLWRPGLRQRRTHASSGLWFSLPPTRRAPLRCSGRWRHPRARHPLNPLWPTSAIASASLHAAAAKKAVTYYQVLERRRRNPGRVAVRQVEPTRSARSPERAWLPDSGRPDLRTASRQRHVQQSATSLDRQALHARLLGFVHPITSERLRFSSPPPEDFLSVLSCCAVESRVHACPGPMPSPAQPVP